MNDEHAGRLIAFWAGLHDVGKVIPGFQHLDQKATARLVGYPSIEADERLGHDFAAHVWLAGQLQGRGYAPGGLTGRAPAVCVAQMLGGHHGRFHRPDLVEVRYPLARVPALGEGRWEEQRAALVEAVWQVTGCPKAPDKLPPSTAALVCGIVILADWLASQDDFLRARLPDVPTEATVPALETHLGKSREVAPDLLQAAGLTQVKLRPGRFEQEFPFLPNDLQRSIAERLPELLNGPGLLVVMAPMGEGKTEAAVHAARLMGEAAGAPGMFVALPTMATADQMYGRIREYAARRVEGTAPLTLLHSMAWLNPLYAQGATEAIDYAGEGEFVGGDDHKQDRVVVADWLRARKRGLLAPLSVGTIDQALTAVLPTKHNVLRMLGLSGKVLVVDEAHAYDAYMQGLLRRLLLWLAHLGVPIILLSATLPAQTAERLIQTYRQGAGHRRASRDVRVSYPGWIYVDAKSGEITPSTVEARSRELAVTTHGVGLTDDGQADRAAALGHLLTPLLDRGGCVLVVCTTVAEAQTTHRKLDEWRAAIDGRNVPELALLHARFPSRQREEITRKVMTAFGKDGAHRPKAAILVATQVVEQSLDLDFDLVISDLAPVALLLQRAGRGWRHTRPESARGGFTRPELAVLVPTTAGGDLRLPRAWTAVYDESLLIRTHQLLRREENRRIAIPKDVQALVDGVYDETFAEGTLEATLGEADVKRFAEQEVQQQLSKMIAIPTPRSLDNLHPLTEADVDEKLIATRLGTDSVRVLCCYVDTTGQRWLDPQCERRLPDAGHRPDGRFTAAQVRELLAETIPVRSGPWMRARGPETDPPDTWRDNPWLRDLVLLPHLIDANRAIAPAKIGDRRFQLDHDLGLVIS